MKTAKNYETRPTAELVPYAKNARTHSKAQVDQIAESIKRFGFTNPVLIDGSGGIIAGHGRVLAAKKLKMDSVPTLTIDHLTDDEKRAYVLADNKLALNGGWDESMLAEELKALGAAQFDTSVIGFNQSELDEIMGLGKEKDPAKKLKDRFICPPFSVLNAREGWWQDRKRDWLSLGIESEEGRGDNLLKFSETAKISKRGPSGAEEKSGTSIFDPVLCEISYKWFCPEKGLVLDPFAGGSVRGIVAAETGRDYLGCELRGEQVAANRKQADEICKGIKPRWECMDSQEIEQKLPDVSADFVFSCPPYADLEVYSDDPKDLSTMAYADFRVAYAKIIKAACGKLKNNRFACFVVGEVRGGKDGGYYNFVGDTIKAFTDAGLKYYNEIILITAIGSLPIRVGKQFSASRKVGKTHQNVLVFVKGDPKKATQDCGFVPPEDAVIDNGV